MTHHTTTLTRGWSAESSGFVCPHCTDEELRGRYFACAFRTLEPRDQFVLARRETLEPELVGPRRIGAFKCLHAAAQVVCRVNEHRQRAVFIIRLDANDDREISARREEITRHPQVQQRCGAAEL